MLVADHFIKLNRKHPAYIGYNLPVSCNKLRFEGYKEELLKNNIRLRKDYVYSCSSNPKDAYEVTETAFFSPALSTVRVPKYRLGYESAVSLIEMIRSRELNAMSVIYSPKLLIRET